MNNKFVESQLSPEFMKVLACGQATMRGVLDHHAQYIISLIKANEECFILKWMEQNPDEVLSDWEMCHRNGRFGDATETRFYMQRKGDNN
jgi:hypothetical protein